MALRLSVFGNPRAPFSKRIFILFSFSSVPGPNVRSMQNACNPIREVYRDSFEPETPIERFQVTLLLLSCRYLSRTSSRRDRWPDDRERGGEMIAGRENT